MKQLAQLLKSQREAKNVQLNEMAHELYIDASLLSKYENGKRIPSRTHIIKIAGYLEISVNTILPIWLSAQIIEYVTDENDDMVLEALKLAEEQVLYTKVTTVNDTNLWEEKLTMLTKLKEKLNKYRKADSYKVMQALELEYTYNSNKIEGNTLTLQETDVVVNEGITISGKTMREHLEAINHTDAIDFIKYLAKDKKSITESNILKIHNLILRSIDNDNAGRYRTVQVMIKGSKHLPPQPFLVAKQVEEMMIWYNKNGKKLHPVLLAAEVHERLVTIHPFIDGNGRTARLLMNLILLQNGYVIANIKGEANNRLQYYTTLEKAQVINDKNDFIQFILDTEMNCIEKYIGILGG